MTTPKLTATQRFYPTLPEGTHPDTQLAFNDLHDKVYDLRDSLQSMKETSKQEATKPAFTDNLQGIKIKNVTDPSSLKDGMVLKYVAATGQWEPMTP